jgi:hypothetical protein
LRILNGMARMDLAVAGLLSIATITGCETNRAARRDPARSADAPRGDARRSEQTTEYKEKKVVWNEDVDPPLLTIDGKSIAVFKSGSGQRTTYVTWLHPHMSFTSLMEIARFLIDRDMVVNGQKI